MHLGYLCLSVSIFFELITRACLTPLENNKPYFPKYEFYHNLSKLNECLYELSVENPDLVDVKLRYRSRWGQSQYVVHLTNLSSYERQERLNTKPRILISAGEHGREFLPVESAIHLIRNLTRSYRLPLDSPIGNTSRHILNNVDLYIAVILNPDGRTLIERNGDFCFSRTVTGVDLNVELDKRLRKWDFSKTRRIISESECKVFQDLMSKEKLDAYLSLHSGSTQIFIPHRVFNIEGSNHLPSRKVHLSLARKMSDAATIEIPCVSVNVTYTEDSAFNYMSGYKEIPFTFMIGLWGNPLSSQSSHKHCFQVFNPPSEQLKAVVETTLPMFYPFFTHLIKWKQDEVNQNHAKNKIVARAGRLSFSSVAFIFLFCIVFWVFYKQSKVPISWRFFYRRQRRIVSLKSLATAFS